MLPSSSLASLLFSVKLPLLALPLCLLPLSAIAQQQADPHAGHAHSQMQSTVADPLAALQPDSQVYTCSMHPQIRLTDPNARCPICGMALIPVPQEDMAKDETATAAVLRLSPRAAALLQTQVQPVRLSKAEVKLNLPGSLAADQSRIQTISAWSSGRIEQAYVNRTAQTVRAGEPMLEIFSPDLIVIQQELLQAKQLSASRGSLPAGTTLDSARRRLRLLGVPATQIEQILNREQLQDTVTISAPVSGIITDKWVNQGAYVSTGQPLFTVMALDQLWLELEVFEQQLALLQPGLALEVSLPAFAGESFSASIELIEPMLNSSSRTARVRALLPNASGRFQPGMLAQASVTIPLADTLLIPASAVLFTGKQSLVYVQTAAEQPHFTPRQITLGQRVGEQYQVLAGLNEGELVVTQGAFRLDSELQIRGLASMLNPTATGGAPMVHQHGSSSTSSTSASNSVSHADHSMMERPEGGATVTPVKPSSAFVLSDEQQAPLLAAYQQLYLGLISDDLSAWRQGTLAMQQAVAGIAWLDRFPGLLMALKAGEGELEQVTDLESARALFYRHNIGLLRFAELGVFAQGWYEAYCPMARDGEGASWLQPTEQLQNPYFGPMMLKCGDVLRQFTEGA
ncbi:efflux RND transporter periplasmic adaptor subunit [Rheinheimera sp. UJ63]|uniref:efflux RND transporter periplasmic adaptor subunit n=1 Tax=Rheinheimera sp. UJ63 TaxID=2910157 RepID=UPI001F21ABAE|nr:efflux RND transporter periplasmic adaptor subunit [Rheinheimera sp. UJ63]MCF4010368.1 efflux RND transporter periplasmic adaptor subunit [Rheinheimera sp. UJ63]